MPYEKGTRSTDDYALYWMIIHYPATDPSFLPVPASSNSMPAHTPALNCVVPRKRNVPEIFIVSTVTR